MQIRRKQSGGHEDTIRLDGNGLRARMKTLRRTAFPPGPRQKLFKNGPEALSDSELLTILVAGKDTPAQVVPLADRILRALECCNWRPNLSKLLQLEGVGPCRASLVSAAIELVRRRIHPQRFQISWPTDALPLIRYIAERKQEHLICISLNGASEVLAVRVVAVGLLNRVPVHPREVFTDPIAERASTMILARNHATGCVLPSDHDKEITRQLATAGELLGIPVLDHIIFTLSRHFSFLENMEL